MYAPYSLVGEHNQIITEIVTNWDVVKVKYQVAFLSWDSMTGLNPADNDVSDYFLILLRLVHS